MKLILLSGGSGKRLWPLSNDIRSKQFLKILRNEEGEYESMVQRVYRQINETQIINGNLQSSDITIATGSSQVESIKSQLGEGVNIVIEPERRDTFPAILLAAAYLKFEKNTPMDETIIILPVDPYADLEYFRLLNLMDQKVQEGAFEIVLMGTKPTYPSAKYGYIVPERDTDGEFVVNHFEEKPSEEKSAVLIQDGALWNAGVFAFQMGYITKILESYISVSSYSQMQQMYSKLKKTSFDYAVVEKCKSIAVVKYEGTWKDLGTWNTLTEALGEKNIGQTVLGEDCSNTNVINELEIPVVALGMKNVVVAASPDGILVSDKEKSSFLKPYVESIQKRPMYEEKYWGDYKVLDYATDGESKKVLTKRVRISSGKAIAYQSHNVRDEIWTIVSGEGDLLLDGHIRNVRCGDVVYIVKGQKHSIRAVSDLYLIQVEIGEELSEEDIILHKWDW